MRTSPLRHTGPVASLVVAVAGLCVFPALAEGAAIRGVTTTQRGTVRLPGVEIVVTGIVGNRLAGRAVSDGSGQFEVQRLDPGRYQLVARLAGFTDLAPAPVTLGEGETLEVELDLAIAGPSEQVDVVGRAAVTPTDTSRSGEKVSGQMNEFLPVTGDGYHALLPVVPGVVRAPDGRMSLKGAREAQGALQVGSGYANDPSTGNFGMELPGDSIESVEVVPNPYAARDGRFSASVVRIETRSGSNRWRALANGFLPIFCLKICDGGTLGLTAFVPRGWMAGPLVKDRLFISQGVSYRYAAVRVPGLPDDENHVFEHRFDAFTRLDASLSAAHTLSATGAVFVSRTGNLGLGTFVPQQVAPDFNFTGYSVGLRESATLSATTVLESSVTANVYMADTFGHGTEPNQFTVNGQRGSFFNTQNRRTRAVQWTESFTRLQRNLLGEHLFEVGLDVMWAAFTGTSRSHPVEVRRADDTVSQRLDFDGPAAQQAAGLDAAVFAQDRWRISDRFRLEPGLRIERDGVLGRTNASPRAGFVAGVFGEETGVVRGGIGIFYERTPLNVGAFGTYESAALTRFGRDGLTPIAPPTPFVQARGALRTPRSLVWNLEYDHRFGSQVFLKVNHLEREGSGVAVLDPVAAGRVTELRLESSGRSKYAETEVSLRVGTSDLRNVSISYVRSKATTNLNVFDAFYGNLRTPIVRPDQYALAPTDAPNRLLVRGTLTKGQWTVSPVIEVRDGFPYSAIDEDQDFVGVRNGAGRFPRLATVDVSIVRSWQWRGYPVRYGLRLYHILNQFMPRDVQNNVDSPAYGAFSNSIPRRVVFTFTFQAK